MENYDPQHVYDSILALAKQCRHAWDDCLKITLPPAYKAVNKLVMTGMGGSGLGARIIESVYSDELKLPLVRINDYHLPAWTDKHTLVICSSFSGTTEETVQNAVEAQAKGAPWLAVASGGTLLDFAKKNQAPYYQINPLYNPSKQPRMASGYLVTGQLALAAKAGLIKFSLADVESMAQAMTAVLEDKAKSARLLAAKFHDRLVVLVAARHLLGAAHLMKNQMNENAKNFSALFDLPELNHHLMEGLAHPKSNAQNLFFLLFDSKSYEPRIRERLAITQEVIAKNDIDSEIIIIDGRKEIDQAMALIQFGSLLNHNLSQEYRLDPAPVPWVDYFKTRLGQNLGQWK